jgi:formylglycine-generating enzyme required for sulfatase activity
MSGQALFAARCVVIPPPEGAVVLFNGKDMSNWERRNGRPSPWAVTDGVMIAREADVLTRQEFGDHRLHLEFQIPPRPEKADAGYGNSGIYIHGFYEIQIIDSRGRPPHKSESNGAVYSLAAPRSDESLPAGEWQSYDIYFHAPRLDGDRKVISPARITVYLNGSRIHDNIEIKATPGSLSEDRFKATGPVLLQYHGYPLRFRNVWAQKLEERPPGKPIRTMRLKLADDVSVELALIRAGSFMMGSPEGEPDSGIDEKQHRVTLTWLGRYEITNRQFRAFRPDHVSRAVHNEKGDFNGDDQPVVAVNLADAEAFCKWASEKTRRTVRLPTEAEWEYACRAGSTGRYCFGDDPALLAEYGWYAGNSGWVTHPVGRLKPNAWGLYDMHGNVAEWVADWYAYYPGGPQTDPKGPATGSEHAWHECSWSSKPYECRCSQRDRSSPSYMSAALGLRIACEP